MPEANKKVKHDGVVFESGGESLIVPALSFGQVQKFAVEITQHDNAQIKDFSNVVKRFEIRKGIIRAALLRNYEETQITDEFMDEFMTTQNSDDLWKAVLGLNRVDRRVKELGESSPVAPA